MRDRTRAWGEHLVDLVRFDVREQADLVGFLGRWIALGSVVGVLSGVAGAVFLTTLRWVTELRIGNGWLLWFLPAAGLGIGLGYHHLAGRAAEGNNLIIDEIHEPTAWIPRRMAPLVYVGTLATHLFGGSAGREGTAIQMSGSLTDSFCRLVGIDGDDRRVLLIASISGGFGAVFGVPLAGCVFGLEVQSVGRLRYDALVPALTASVVGDLVVRGLGVGHVPTPTVAPVDLSPLLIAKVLLCGLAFGLLALLFSELTHGLKRLFAAAVPYPPLRPMIGGVAIIGLTSLVGTQDYLGLSLPLIGEALAGAATLATFAFALKLLFTVVTLGSGFLGGEVTPLFVIGATAGATFAQVLDLPPELMAAVGFVAVFAGATNTPLACTVMGLELFGTGPAVPLLIACTVAYVFSSHRSIYTAQRVDTPKGGGKHPPGTTIATISGFRARGLRGEPATDPLAEPSPDEKAEGDAEGES